MTFIAGFALGVLATIGFSLLTVASDDEYDEYDEYDENYDD